MNGYLVNDFLTCIPNTRTFWHDLLEWFPEISDKCNGDFNTLPQHIESLPVPDLIIRNASFFRHINIPSRTISLLQDYCESDLRKMQIEVCNKSDMVVFNSTYTASLYADEIKTKSTVIPLGTDFNFFHDMKLDKKYDIIFIGSTNEIKGFSTLLNLINTTNYKFCLVMKDNFTIDNPNVDVFIRIDSISVREKINQSKMLLCLSTKETLHLAGVEAGACNVPILTTDVGIYHNMPGKWGMIISNIKKDTEYILNNINAFDTRNVLMQNKLDKQSCKREWSKLIYD